MHATRITGGPSPGAAPLHALGVVHLAAVASGVPEDANRAVCNTRPQAKLTSVALAMTVIDQDCIAPTLSASVLPFRIGADAISGDRRTEEGGRVVSGNTRCEGLARG